MPFQSSRSLRTATFDPQELVRAVEFQSSRSLRTATSASGRNMGAKDFNPRGPCGPRLGGQLWTVTSMNFNPRGPCGPRRNHHGQRQHSGKFQSSRSLRTATVPLPPESSQGAISILAVLADRDHRCCRRCLRSWYFNPRGPCGPRPLPQGVARTHPGISILAVLADRDLQWR